MPSLVTLHPDPIAIDSEGDGQPNWMATSAAIQAGRYLTGQQCAVFGVQGEWAWLASRVMHGLGVT
ncbi:hypothetical protein [Pseudomonas sp. 43NM1]|uniref:hypothetical protein n=1 Tax=Pseudomonas sp. 43NM1 TaxID=1904755 RepID=UPI0012FF1319|nr:hypothetical protein [Pseudomonas sp. 43NM1]